MPTRIVIPKETLRRLYHEEGLTQKQIAQMFGCSRKTIGNLMRGYKIPRRTAGDYTRLDIPREELERLYGEEGLSSEEVAGRFGCSVAAIRSSLVRYGIPTRPPGWNSRKRYVPDGVLDHWSAELAYAVGLIATDGHLDRDHNSVGLSSTDLELILLYYRCLHVDCKIHVTTKGDPRWKPRYRVRFSDPVYRAFLERIGLTAAKSKTIGPLDVPDDLFPDFLRGCLDGDGSWYLYHRAGREYLYAQLVSASPAFLIWVRETVRRLKGLEGGISGGQLRYGGRKAVELGSWLYYAPSVPCLKRKRAIWERFTEKAPAPVGGSLPAAEA